MAEWKDEGKDFKDEGKVWKEDVFEIPEDTVAPIAQLLDSTGMIGRVYI